MIGVIRNALNLLNVTSYFQLIAIGVIIVMAVESDVLRNHLESRIGSDRRRDAGMQERARSGSARRAQAFRCGPCAQGYRPHGLSWGSACLAGRQRRRQVHPDQMRQRGAWARRRRHPDRWREVSIRTPAAARGAGIETVYQDLALFDNLTPAENFYCGRELSFPSWLPRGARFLATPADGGEAAAVIDRLKVKLPKFDAQVALMSGGQRQAIAVARAAVFARKVVILDEPTAALGLRESAEGPRPHRPAQGRGECGDPDHPQYGTCRLNWPTAQWCCGRGTRSAKSKSPIESNQQDLVAMIVGAE